jgi:hypothetical protein
MQESPHEWPQSHSQANCWQDPLNAHRVYSTEDKQEFLELGEEWWWQSNRSLPINLVIGPKFKKFSYCLRTYNVKDFEILHGEAVSLQNIITKRIKRRQIQLVQKL